VALRGRLTLMSALIVGATLVLASLVAYFAVRGELYGQVDDALRSQTQLVDTGGRYGREPPRDVPELSPRQGGPGAYVQFVSRTGVSIRPRDQGFDIPVTAGDRAVAAGVRRATLSDRRVDGTHLRVLTAPVGDFGALQLARPLDGADSVLSRLRLVLVLLCLVGIGLAAGLSRLFSRPVMRPITELTETAEHIEATGDLGRRIEGAGDDEVGRMAGRFNAMLDRLQLAYARQRQLVADASHELRTPVTSLRTNVEVLRESDGLTEAERRALLDDVVEQTEELGALVGDVIELARDGEAVAQLEEVRLDELVHEAVVRARRNAPGVRFSTALAPTVVLGVPERIGRAVNNLLDNAGRHSPPGETVEVTVAEGELSVRDHGSGVAAADQPHIFERFYRGAAARGTAGSGLGLAIVRQVAESHGGSVRVEDAPGCGARFVLTLPVAAE
jgi:two-component system sensor histidine kinase MprB